MIGDRKIRIKELLGVEIIVMSVELRFGLCMREKEKKRW